MTTTSSTLSALAMAARLVRMGRHSDALSYAQRAVQGERTCVPAHGMLAAILFELGRVDEADAVVTDALKRDYACADACDALAHVSLLLGEHERSNALYRRVVQLDPEAPRFWYNLASSERSLGRLGEAEAAYARAITLDRGQYAAYLLRSELRVQTSSSNHIGELRQRLAERDLDASGRIALGYALGKELDDLHCYNEAFHWFSHAATARRRKLLYDVAVDERKLRRIEEVFPGGGGARSEDVDSSRFIFIVGLPRSGTTLFEHILSGLPNVKSNGETENFSRALLAATPSGNGDVFARAAGADMVAVAQGYARLASGAGGGGKKYIIEKLPMNYLYIGAIRWALPQARIVLVTRHPVDSCFAMYRTLFGSAYPFSYDFNDLARYYAAYDRLVSHWQASLSEGLYRSDYESLVLDPASEGRRVAEYCGLEWSPDAIDIEKSTAVSLTASAAQIRRPIYRTSVGRWRFYRNHLQTLAGELQRHGIDGLDDACA